MTKVMRKEARHTQRRDLECPSPPGAAITDHNGAFHPAHEGQQALVLLLLRADIPALYSTSLLLPVVGTEMTMTVLIS